MATTTFDLTSRIIEYVTSVLNAIGTLELFAMLIRMGRAWTLQGFYGRTATDLIEVGHITPAARAGR